MTGVPPHNGLVMQSFGLLLRVVFVLKRHGAHVMSLQLKPDFTINAILQKKVPRPNVDEINGVPSYMTPHACTHDPRFFSHKR